MPEFLITHPSTIYATVTARDAQHALLVARAGAQWLPSDTPNLDLNEMHAEPTQPRAARTPYRVDDLTFELRHTDPTHLTIDVVPPEPNAFGHINVVPYLRYHHTNTEPFYELVTSDLDRPSATTLHEALALLTDELNDALAEEAP